MCECGSPMVGRQEVLQPPMGMGSSASCIWSTIIVLKCLHAL
jgi:hypothetical protein